MWPHKDSTLLEELSCHEILSLLLDQGQITPQTASRMFTIVSDLARGQCQFPGSQVLCDAVTSSKIISGKFLKMELVF
jgi:hypothetical protein